MDGIFELAKTLRGEKLSSGVKLSIGDLQDRIQKLTKFLAFTSPARTKRKFKKKADKFIPHKRTFQTDNLPPKLDPLQVIDILNVLNLAIKRLEGLTIENIRNLNSL